MAAGIVGLVFGLFANVLPFLFTYGAYNEDRYEVMGFPFFFHRVGGLRYKNIFVLSNMLWDCVFVLGCGVAVPAILALWRSPMMGKVKGDIHH